MWGDYIKMVKTTTSYNVLLIKEVAVARNERKQFWVSAVLCCTAQIIFPSGFTIEGKSIFNSFYQQLRCGHQNQQKSSG